MRFQILYFLLQTSGDLALTFVSCVVVITLIVIYILMRIKQINKTNQKEQELNKKAYLAKETARKKVQEAYLSYQKSLQELKATPSNPDLKQRALKLGRAYAEISRSFVGDPAITIYDEMSVMNDINAACAAASNPNQARNSSVLINIEERLLNLQNLKKRGLIDDSEYDSKRKRILGEI